MVIWTVLFHAAEKGDVQVVEVLLRHGADVNKSDENGQTVLFHAAEKGDVRVVEVLLRHGADVNKSDENGQTALFIAARKGKVEVVQVLLSHGADVNKSDEYGETALFTAAMSVNVEVVEVLLHNGADVNKSDKDGQTALFHAARKVNVKVVEVLLHNGADVNKSANDGQTALFTAARFDVEVVQVLLHHGADVNKSDENGQTALFAAAMFNNVEVVQVLLSHGADVNKSDKYGQTALFTAVKWGNVEIVEVLLHHGADVNKNGWNILYHAAENGNVKVVKVLLCHGADVNKSDEYGGTALFTAAMLDNAEVVEVMLCHGADVNKSDENGQTALFTAARKGSVEVVEVMLRHGADVNKSDKDGQTALFHAARKVKVVEVMLSHDADVNKSNKYGQTALFTAAMFGKVEVVQVLLHHGADVNKSDENGQTALFAAAMYVNVEVVKVLLYNGADVNKSDKNGQTALFAGVKFIRKCADAIEIIKLFLSYGGGVNAKTLAGETLLQQYLSNPIDIGMEIAAACSPIKLCQFLVETCNVDVSVRTPSGHSVIHLVLQLLRDTVSQEEVHVFELHNTSKKTIIAENLLNLLCLISSSHSCPKSLCSSRDDVDGNTPLHLWASLDCPTASSLEPILSDIGELLLSKGAKVNDTNANGETPLHLAQTWNAAKFLSRQGALLNARDSCGNTPLLKHIKQNVGKHTFKKVYNDMRSWPTEQWEETLHLAFDPWKANDEGETVLSILLQTSGFTMICGFLKATGAPYGLKYPVDSNGDTPLHVICRDSRRDNLWNLKLIDCLFPSATQMINCLSRKKDTALHILCQNAKADALSCKMIERLLARGAQVNIPDGNGRTCQDIAEDDSELRDLLRCEWDRKVYESLLPWSPMSERYKTLLTQVAGGQKAEQAGILHYHINPIGFGAFGHVHAGINSKDGTEIAVKRVERSFMNQFEDHMNMRKLVQLEKCEYVVSYLSYHRDQDFLYIALELMEGNLEELMNWPARKKDLIPLCKDVLSGLNFLHQKHVLHRDIKPSNILYKQNRSVRLKLADFGLSCKTANVRAQTTRVMHSKAGTRCWMAPELLEGTADHSETSDVFACGLVLHYLLSGKKHPFGPENETGKKSAVVVEIETERNLYQNNRRIDESLSSKAKDLVNSMVRFAKDKRPSVVKALSHPLFESGQEDAD